MSAVSPGGGVLVLTTDGRRRLAERLQRIQGQIESIDRDLQLGQAGDDDLGERGRLDEQARELRRVLADAADVTAVDEDPSIVEIGDAVDIEDEHGAIATYSIVHAAEVDAGDNRISAVSPLGRALLGTRPGDTVTVRAPAGAYKCRVRARRRLA